MLTALFNCVAGLTLFLFVVHYVYYILNALATTTANSHQPTDEPPQQHSSMQQTEDAKFIKKLVFSCACVCACVCEWSGQIDM